MEGTHPCKPAEAAFQAPTGRIGEKRLFSGEFFKKTVFSRKYLVDNVGRGF
jgi:hypothetical protein